MPQRHPAQRAFTLVELVASMVVLGVVASVAAPLIASASDAFVKASSNRDDVERVSHAMDRVIRLLRTAPATAPGSGQPDITVATADHIEFGDGSELQLVGTTLMLTPAGGVASPLCAGVTVFELSYLLENGNGSSIGTPLSTQRMRVRIVANGQELRSAVFLRIATGSPAP